MKKSKDLLDTYRKKRRAEATPEPFGEVVASSDAEAQSSLPSLSAFVVHQHLATRLHYDLRIECDGVLQSFAVPKGPSLDPAQKHLAVRTEPHPIEYLDFEDVIPSGNYGAGPMIVWDRGSLTPLGKPLSEQLDTDKLDFVLHGRKVQGRFSLVKLKGEDKNYLLLKKADRYVSAEGAEPVTTAFPESIVSCLRAEELASKVDLGQAVLEKAKGIAGKKKAPSVALPVIRESATSKHKKLWPWFEGVRVLAARDDDLVTLASDAGEDVTGFYPDVVLSLRALAVTQFVCDGLLVIDAEDGISGLMPLLRRAEWLLSGDEHAALLALPATLYVRALLRCGASLFAPADAPFAADLLDKFVRGRGIVRVLPSFESKAEDAVRAFCSSQGLPGMVAAGDGELSFVSAKDGGVAALAPAFSHASRAGSVSPKKRGVTSPAVARTSNRQKIFWPELGLTKGDMLDYYAKVAPVMLPYLRDRPLSVVLAARRGAPNARPTL